MASKKSKKSKACTTSLRNDGNWRTLFDLPAELIDIIFKEFSVKTLVVITRVCRAIQMKALEILERRLHTLLRHEYQDVFLRLGWYTPMKRVKKLITWEYNKMVSLSDGDPHNTDKDRKPPLPSVDKFSIFGLGGFNGDPWFDAGRKLRCYDEDDWFECCNTNMNGDAEDDINITENVSLDWNEDFVQFRLRMYLEERSGRSKPHKIENKMIRIHRDWLDQWDEKGKHVDHPNEYRLMEHLVWFDDKKTIGLQLAVERKKASDGHGTDVYHVYLGNIWLRTFRLLLEDEAAEKGFEKKKK
ncbi:uncharacterized protein N7483_003836 [Penicillium malachiteum]|uniref:uncharacterized protein n=1 Tax=Penicillium malachiteum TaxID=1324776 RepID=UPI0025487D50|nr:uncharacterized protein N7483_003836 [Penicillium malachiteum]KAJ5729328.1 hypothetical protein N7483_003836 [Penicillium malachiteum]